MENEKIEAYLKKIQEIEQTLSNDDEENVDMSFLNQIEGILNEITTDISKDEINNYIKQRGSGVGLSSILGRPSTTSALVSTATTSPKNDGILSALSTIF